MDPLAYGLTWFVWGGLAVTLLLAWARALEWAMVHAVSTWLRSLATVVFVWGIFLLILAVVIHLDLQAMDPLPHPELLP